MIDHRNGSFVEWSSSNLIYRLHDVYAGQQWHNQNVNKNIFVQRLKDVLKSKLVIITPKMKENFIVMLDNSQN